MIGRTLAIGVALFGTTAIALAAAPPPGAVAQLPGSAGCEREHPGESCATAVGIDNPSALAASPDGHTLYVASNASDAVAVFSRTMANGALTQPRGSAACVRGNAGEGCAVGAALDGADGIAVSADGRNVYVAAAAADAIAVFARNPDLGTLTQLAGAAACVSSRSPAAPCTTAVALDGASGVAVSGDGKNVYAVSASSDAVAVFARNPATGALTQLAAPAGCVSSGGSPSCAKGTSLDDATAVVVTPDGRDVYVAAAGSADAIVGFARDPATGALTQLALPDGCIADAGRGGCAVASPLDDPRSLVVSPDGRMLYAAASASDAVLAIARSPSSGALAQLAGDAGCVRERGGAGCATATGLDDVRAVALNAAGSSLYAVASSSDALTTFARDGASGRLTQLAGPAGCTVQGSTRAGCAGGRAMDGAVALTVSGSQVHVGSQASDGVATFAAETSPVCADAAPQVPANGHVSIVLACSDANGQPLTRKLLSQPQHGKLGSISTTTGAVTYTPSVGYAGPDQFTFEASDGIVDSAAATARITVGLPATGPAVQIVTSAAAVRIGFVRVRLACPATAIGSCQTRTRLLTHAVISLPGRRARHVLLGVRRYTVPHAHSVLVAVRLTPTARGLLRRRHRLRVDVVVVARDRAGHDSVSRRTIPVRWLRR